MPTLKSNILAKTLKNRFCLSIRGLDRILLRKQNRGDKIGVTNRGDKIGVTNLVTLSVLKQCQTDATVVARGQLSNFPCKKYQSSDQYIWRKYVLIYEH